MFLSKKIFIIFLCLSLLIGANISYASNLNERQKYEAASTFLRNALDLGRPHVNLIVRMLEKRKYSELEKYFRNLEDKYKKNTSYESLLLKSYQLFDSRFDELLPKINEWVDKTGTSRAYCARGFYYANKGWEARGKKYIQDTPHKNISNMEMFHQKAKLDLGKAIEIDPKNMPAYFGLIDIYKAEGNDSGKRLTYNKAISHDKRTYYVRHAYIQSLVPKWGGSYKQMQAVIEESVRYAQLNPRIWSLRGEVDDEKANALISENDCSAAIPLLTKALSYGDRTSWLYDRAYCYGVTKHFKLELKDLEKYLFYKPRQNEVEARVKMLKQYLSETESKARQVY